LRFPKKNVLFVFVLGALMIPEEVTILPNYLTVARLHWVNTYLGLVVPTFGSAFGTFLMRQHFLSLPKEVLEAAEVDGASHLARLWRVVLPMSRPVLATLLLLTVVQRWNDFLWPLIVTNSSSMRTLPIGIFTLFQQEGTTVWGAVMAGAIFVVLPVLVLYLWAQRYIVEGIASGAVKG
jgi:multiple sugar transport system permease protein/sn-glycerol 3-phosphate transport system permease protein